MENDPTRYDYLLLQIKQLSESVGRIEDGLVEKVRDHEDRLRRVEHDRTFERRVDDLERKVEARLDALEQARSEMKVQLSVWGVGITALATLAARFLP